MTFRGFDTIMFSFSAGELKLMIHFVVTGLLVLRLRLCCAVTSMVPPSC